MPLILHNNYTLGQACAELVEDGLAESFCEGQFRVGENVILCFFKLGPNAKPLLRSPSSIDWRPARTDYHPVEQIPWFPLPVRETDRTIRTSSDQNLAERLQLSQDQAKTSALPPKQHHIFLSDGNSDFLYAGAAHLASYSMSIKKPESRFDLTHALPRDAWLRFGGYDGWLVTVNHIQTRVPKGDSAVFQTLLPSEKSPTHWHVEMTRYEQDSLSLYTNPTRGWLMYLRTPDDCGLYINNLNETPEPRERFFCSCGIDLDFPRDRTLLLEESIEVLKEFFRTGQLSARYEWTIDEI